jgi:hypothetical protein
MNRISEFGRRLGKALQDISVKLIRLYHPQTWKEKGLLWSTGLFLVTLVIIATVLAFIWSREPEPFDVRANALEMLNGDESRMVTGAATVTTTIRLAETLLDKPGGYLSNDITPPSIFLDNIPNWEFGVVVQIRDISRALRNDFSRSQSQSIEDKDLMLADPQFNFDTYSWMFPPTEREYGKGIKALQRYLNRLTDPNQPGAQFYARADNLREWLGVVEKRLGSLSQRLSASVGQLRVNTDLAGDSAATQSTSTSSNVYVKTPWMQIDNVFYEARGSSWALLHLMKAIEIDFDQVLAKKNARASLRQIIRELEGSQEPLYSPVILNGSGFGLVANHSLVMASYISRANAAIIDLRNLLEQG